MNNVTIYRGKPVGAEMLSKEQRDAVAYFFFRLKAIDPAEYDRLLPDSKTERIVKREYAGSLIPLSKENMDAGFAYWHKKRQEGDPDFRFLNIDRVIGLMYENDSGFRGHKYIDGLEKDDDGEYYRVRLPEPEEIRQARKDRGRQHCRRLLSIFDE